LQLVAQMARTVCSIRLARAPQPGAPPAAPGWPLCGADPALGRASAPALGQPQSGADWGQGHPPGGADRATPPPGSLALDHTADLARVRLDQNAAPSPPGLLSPTDADRSLRAPRHGLDRAVSRRGTQGVCLPHD